MTGAAGFMFVTGSRVNFIRLIAFLTGNALVIACGCIVNNIIDRDIDSKMERTQKRPLVTGKINVTSAAVFAVICLIAGTILLWKYTNLLTLLIGYWALFFYVVVYGYAKRTTSYGTEVGSLPGAASILAGYTAVTAHIDMTGIILFLSLVFWQMPHFFAIAIFRAKEYAAAKIPVLPLTKGLGATKLRMLGYTIVFAGTSLALYFTGYASKTYAVVMAVTSAYWLILGVRGLNTPHPVKWARKMFSVSLLVLLVFCLVLVLDSWLP